MSRFLQVDNAQVMIGYFAIWTDQEVRGDQPVCTDELAVTIVDAPGDGSMLHPGFWTGAKIALSDGAEPKPVTVIAKRDLARLQERRLASKRHLRFEAHRAARGRINHAGQPLGSNQGGNGAARCTGIGS